MVVFNRVRVGRISQVTCTIGQDQTGDHAPDQEILLSKFIEWIRIPVLSRRSYRIKVAFHYIAYRQRQDALSTLVLSRMYVVISQLSDVFH